VTLFCCDGRDEPRFADAASAMNRSGVKVKLLPIRREIRPWHDVRAMIRLCREIKSGAYDLVHTHGSKAGLLGRLAARAAGRPAVHTPHCYAFLRSRTWMKSYMIRAAERMLRGSMSGLIAVCKSEKAQAIKHGLVDPTRCVVVPNGMPMVENAPSDRGQLRRMLDLPASSFVVTMAARLVGYKGIGLFLEAAELCRGIDAMFVLAGYGELEHQARKRVASLGLSDRVRVLGHVKEVPLLLNSSDLCVLCSQAEGQPYALLEAMRGDCPIVATAVPGIRDLLEHGKTAILVRQDAGELAGAIRRLANDDALRGRLAARAKERFLEAHLLERQIDALIEAYERFRSSPQLKAAPCS
jgi:glycosyltransferase involved in cell wall biosynthesis